jgi:hypothetical protein
VQNNRWFVVWLGSANHPVDKAAAKTLAESIQPYVLAPPPDQGPPDQNPPGPPPRRGGRRRSECRFPWHRTPT